QLFGRHQAGRAGVPPWVHRLKEILHDTSGEPLTLQALSTLLGIHPVHISRAFPEYFSCSFGEYLRRLRVERSLRLLSDTSLSLSAIAAECGFADQSHFTRCFKEMNGILPSEYRKHILR
ncbi:MAG TPA: AraC family transcriptional regulator, partial [Bacteroidota bacterium]|nr:AraC family transcriptional regulator [Bacteroidota bacterium]